MHDIFKSAEFWSAIVGALVGGLLTLLAQYFSYREQRAERRAELHVARKALATSIFFKLSRLISNVHALRAEFPLVDEGAPNKEPLPMPVANIPDPIHFLPEEMGLILDLKKDDLFNSLFDLDAKHNALIAVVAAYSAAHESLTDEMTSRGKIVAERGQLLTQEFTDADYHVLQPKKIKAASIATEVRKYASSLFDSSESVLRMLHAALSSEDLLKFNIAIKSTDAVTL